VIEPTDDMVQLAVGKFLDSQAYTIGEIDAAMRDALAAVFAIVDPSPADCVVCVDARFRVWKRPPIVGQSTWFCRDDVHQGMRSTGDLIREYGPVRWL